MSEEWYRGQSTSVAPSKPGGSIHDFGDGMYLTSSKEVADLYAKTRVAHGGGQAEVLVTRIDRADLGRVLDLTKDTRWQQYLREPQIPGRTDTTPEQLIRRANENYGRFFEQFLQRHKISINKYDAVIGPEFVRGGSQLAILHQNGKPSGLADRIRASLRPVGAPGSGPGMPVVSGKLLLLKGMAKGVAGNQAAMAALGVQLGGAIQSLGDLGIRRKVDEELQSKHAGALEKFLADGEGVLVIVRLQEWERADFNGMRARTLLGVSLQPGPSQEAALMRWRNTPRLLAGPAKGWRTTEQYAWISPAS